MVWQEWSLKKGERMAAYRWKTPELFSVDANDAKAELDRIGGKYGSFKASDIVEESRPEDAVLHGCFEWDDGVAAEKYREQQARYIVKNITVVSESGNTEESVRAFVHVKQAYRPIQVVLSDKEMKEELLAIALRELEAFARKYRTLKELAPVFEAIAGVSGKEQ